MWNDSPRAGPWSRPPIRPGLGEPVDAAEVQRLVADVELLQAGEAGAHHDVALGARLERAAAAEVEHALQASGAPRPA